MLFLPHLWWDISQCAKSLFFLRKKQRHHGKDQHHTGFTPTSPFLSRSSETRLHDENNQRSSGGGRIVVGGACPLHFSVSIFPTPPPFFPFSCSSNTRDPQLNMLCFCSRVVLRAGTRRRPGNVPTRWSSPVWRHRHRLNGGRNQHRW